MDVAQTAVTMMFVLEEHYGIDLEKILEDHLSKLAKKVIATNILKGKGISHVLSSGSESGPAGSG
jgi:hypothetical protein